MQTKSSPQRAKPGDKYIYIYFESLEKYAQIVEDAQAFREYVTKTWEKQPELFGQTTARFVLHSHYDSKKLKLKVRRIKMKDTKQVYTIRPSHIMPYMIGKTDEVERGLYLRHWNVPYEAIAHTYGHSAMYWYRAELSLGRPSLVGSSVKDPACIPEDLVADEKFTWVNGKEVYVPVIVGANCILGIDVTPQADSAHLQNSYAKFASEAQAIQPDYAPKSICLDGWKASHEAWKRLYPNILIVLCFLHSILAIKDRCTTKQGFEVLKRAWHLFRAKTKQSLSQRVRRFGAWSKQHLSGVVAEKAQALIKKRDRFAVAFERPTAHRTSNAVDRAIDYLDRRFYAMRYGHSSLEATALLVRSMAFQYNFHPFGQHVKSANRQRLSRFADLNGFQYHPNWLHNYLIASSRGGLSTHHKFR